MRSDYDRSPVGRPQNGPPDGSDPPALPAEIDLREYIDLIRRRWWIPVLVGLAAGATVYWESLSRPPQYSADVLLQRQETGTSFELLGMGLGSGITPEDVNTQIEILQSRGVVGPVVDTLQLTLQLSPPHVPRSRFFDMVRVDPTAPDGAYVIRVSGTGVALVDRDTGATVGEASSGGVLEGPGFLVVLTDAGRPLREEEVPLAFSIEARADVIQDLADEVDIEHVRGTNLIRVGHVSPDRELAAAVVNTLTASYQAYSSRQGRNEARRRREFLEIQLAQLADSMAAAQQQLADHQSESRTLNPDIEGAALLDALLQAENEVWRLRFEESVVSGVVRTLQSGDESTEFFERMLTIGADLIPAAEGMYERLRQVQTERRRLTDSRFGLTPAAPEVEPLDSMIASIKSEMRGVLEYSQVLVQDQLTRARERVEEIQGEVGELPARAAVFTRFQQRVDQVQNIFDMLVENYYEAQIAESVESGDLALVDSAPIPIRPDPSSGRRDTILAALIGIVLGVGLALYIEHFDTRIRSVAEAEQAAQLRVLASIPLLPSVNGSDRILLLQPQWDERESDQEVTAGTEAFRMLRTTLRFAEIENAGVLAFTSAQPADGKTTVAANLAILIAFDGGPVLLIDGDLRRPRLHRVFGIDRRLGLSDVLDGNATVDEVIKPTDYSNLAVMPAGSWVPNPAELLGRKGFAELLGKASSDYTVIVDCPPSLSVADASLIGKAAGGVVLVARSDVTPEPALASAVQNLRQLGVPLVGLVLNGDSASPGYYYNYSDSEGHDRPAKRSLVDILLRRT